MFGWDFYFMLSRDSEDEMRSIFVFEIVIWPQEVTLARLTQPSGPFCLWQCLDNEHAIQAVNLANLDILYVQKIITTKKKNMSRFLVTCKILSWWKWLDKADESFQNNINFQGSCEKLEGAKQEIMLHTAYISTTYDSLATITEKSMFNF